jgi:membrane fusion protein (multidrug efflux system)
MKPRFSLACLAALVALSSLGACKKAPTGPAAAPPVEVGVMTVALKDVPVTFEYVGQTESSQQVEIRARVAGFLEKRVYTEGAMVHEGDVLYKMDRKPFEAALDAAKAEYAQQRARLTTAQQNLDRVKPLAEKNALSQKDLDDALGQQQAAAAGVENARANVTSAELNLGYTTIVAPVTGLSSFSKKQDGTYVDASNSLLTYVAKLDPMWVNFSLSENELLQLRTQAKSGALKVPSIGTLEVEIVLADGSVVPNVGRISFADASFNTETGTYLVRAEVPNHDGTLRPGQFVRVKLHGASRTKAISVPQVAVLQGDRGPYVWTVGADGKAQQRVIETGEWSGDEWIVRSGLNAGDQVVVENIIRVAPGATLKASPATLHESSAAANAGAAGTSGASGSNATSPSLPGAAAGAAPTKGAGAKGTTAGTTASSADASAFTPGSKPKGAEHAASQATVLFDTGSAQISTDAATKLAPIVAEWHGMPGARAAVSGYVDSSGSHPANVRLAEARAKSVRAALIIAGIPESRIEMRAPANIVAGSAADARHVEIMLLPAGDRR